MLYTVIEKINKDDTKLILLNENRTVKLFKSKKEANIERIYLQPDYENRLKVIGMK